MIIAKSLRSAGGHAAGRLLGVRIGAGSLEDLVAACRDSIGGRRASFVFACANPHSLVVARADESFRRALNAASAVVADGVGCSWVAALAGVPVGPRITGSDFFAATMAMLNDRGSNDRATRDGGTLDSAPTDGSLDTRGGRAFFFGSTDRTLERLVERASRDYPSVGVATLSPPFGNWSREENDAMIAAIRAFDPDVLWVGMTAPKQEKWVHENAAALAVPVIGSIGAVFDYYAGVTVRAPQWICALGLEWLYRLPREPRRLWRRTFVSAPVFVWCAVRERFARSRA